MKNGNHASGSSAWAWATLGIVFIVFYFGSGSSRSNRDREANESARPKKLQSKPSVIVESRSSGSRVWSTSNDGDVVVESGIDVEDATINPGGGKLVHRSQAFLDSMKWLNRSVESLGEKLGKISANLGEDVDKQALKRDIREAFRDAFGQVDLVEDAVQSTATTLPNVDELPEVASNESIDAALNTSPEAPAPPVPPQVTVSTNIKLESVNDRPILGEGVPDWVRDRITEGDMIMVPIESSMYTTVEECREELDAKLVGEAKRVLDAHVLKHVPADSIPELTSTYIREKFIDRKSEFDNYQERPSGNYHQLWVRMAIDKKEINEIREWERSILTQERVVKLGGVAGGVLGSIAGFSGLIGLLARREKKARENQAKT